VLNAWCFGERCTWRLIRIRVKSSNLSAEQFFLLLSGVYSPISLYIHATSSSDT
jgi:hypothetical protein